jgi:hypothetical protein
VGGKISFIIYLTPCVPLSLIGEGEGIKKRGKAPLRHPLHNIDKICINA